MNSDYPFENGRDLSWALEGFGPDEWPCSSVTLAREQFLKVRGLFALGDDEWMTTGDHPVPVEVQGSLQAVVETALFEEGVDYFLGACQDLPPGPGLPLDDLAVPGVDPSAVASTQSVTAPQRHNL
ncbi:hypothetical protein AB0O82_30250 [Kitasatospora sp. NPDC088264]|uniref:hypothetical protein n=1 Tax=Kitasatospora sp. NPDC088264 TaxID=3155296 RepID=UPI00342B7600